MWPRSHFFWDLVSLTHSQHRRWMLTSSFLSRCLSNGLLLFWEAVTRSVLDRPLSRLLGLLATKAAVTGTSMVHDPWLCFLLFCFGFFWCETTCELHNNLIHPHWKHEIHKQGAHKGGLTAFYTLLFSLSVQTGKDMFAFSLWSSPQSDISSSFTLYVQHISITLLLLCSAVIYREQHSLYRGSGSAESPATHV